MWLTSVPINVFQADHSCKYLQTTKYTGILLKTEICYGKGGKLSSTGRRPASLCHGPLSVVCVCVCVSVCAFTFSLNISFSKTTYGILMKLYRNVPAMVLFRNLERI